MALYLDELQAGSKTIDVRFPSGAVLSVTYRPDKLTSELVSQTGDGAAELPEIMVALLSDWDLSDRDGKKVPISEDTFLSKLRLPIVNKILEAIIDDAFPKAEETQSTGSSRRRAR